MPSEFHVDAALSNFSVSEKFNGQDAYIAGIIAPQFPVKKKSDVFYRFKSDYINTDLDDQRDGKGFANEVSWTFTTDNFSTKERALRKFSTQNELDNADDVVQVDQRDALHIKQRLLLSYERRVQALAAATTFKLTPTTKWDATGTTTIMADIVTAKNLFREQVGVDPTHLVMDSKVADLIAIQPEIQNITKYLLASGKVNDLNGSLIATSGSTLQNGPGGGSLPAVLQGMTVVVAKSFYNTANPQQTRSVVRTWGKDVYLVYVDPTPSIEVPTWAKTFVFENLTMWQYTQAGRRGRYVEGYWTIDEKETLSGAIFKIVSVIS